jgi:hypothetical protein
MRISDTMRVRMAGSTRRIRIRLRQKLPIMPATQRVGTGTLTVEAMTRSNSLAVITSALVAGYFGGFLGSRSGKAGTANSLRASRFELVNASGQTTALLESDDHGESHIRFLARGNRTILDMGALSDGRPFMIFNGSDRKKRVVIELDQTDKPSLSMGDGRWEGRAHLGYIGPDTPDPNWDRWGLSFLVPGSGIPVASIGVTLNEEKPKGFLTISGERVR